MSYLNRNRLKNFFVNLKKYFKSEEFLNSMAISNAEIDNIANTAGYNDNGTGTVNYDFVPRSGGAVMTGSSLGRTVDDSFLSVRGGTDYNLGAYLQLYGKNHSTKGGQIALVCRKSDGTAVQLTLQPDGTATWGNKNFAMQENVVPRSGGAVMTGNVLQRIDNSSYLTLRGGSDYDMGAQVTVRGKDADVYAGAVYLHPSKGSSGSDWKDMYLYPSGTWTWNGTACQITSDQRFKQQISQIDDKLLDAWKDVAPVQFKYNDSVNEKGDKARLHTGYVVQQIAEACQNHDVNIDNYGLYCHEVYPERTEEVTIENEDGTTKKETKVIEEASEHYSLRYTEALIVECAFLRREVERLTERVTKLESRKKRTTS